MDDQNFNSNMPEELATHFRTLTRHIHMQNIIIEAYRIAMFKFAKQCDILGGTLTPEMNTFLAQFTKTINSTNLEHIEANYERLYNSYMNA